MDIFTMRKKLQGISVYSGFTWKEKSQGISVDSTNDENNCTTKTTLMTVNTCVNVQWGVSNVHVGIRVGDHVVSDCGAGCVPGILESTPGSIDQREILKRSNYIKLSQFKYLNTLLYSIRINFSKQSI